MDEWIYYALRTHKVAHIQRIFIKANMLCTHAHKEMYSDEQEKMNHPALFGTQKKMACFESMYFSFLRALMSC